MSDTPTPTGNGGPDASNEPEGPSFAVLAQYLKDLSFENPRAPEIFQDVKTPKMDVGVDVNARSIATNQYEVELSVSAKAMHENEAIFIVEASYAGAFEIRNIPRDQLEGVMLVECPRLLFPFMRQIIADATRNGNFPPLMLEPIDFMAIYLANRQRQQQPGGLDGAVTTAPSDQNA